VLFLQVSNKMYQHFTKSYWKQCSKFPNQQRNLHKYSNTRYLSKSNETGKCL